MDFSNAVISEQKLLPSGARLDELNAGNRLDRVPRRRPAREHSRREAGLMIHVNSYLNVTKLTIGSVEHRRDVKALIDAVVAAVNAARAVERPFFHLKFERVFPDDIYAWMMAAMPAAQNYRPLPGRNNGNLREDGVSTRVKIDLFPEHIRHFSRAQRPIWDLVGRALVSPKVQSAFVRRLAPGLERRFGKNFGAVGLYPIPVLTRDIPGYRITPHTDTHWKGITVQFYLPRDSSAVHLGTVFHERAADGSLHRASQMKFAPNTGYAFAVGEDTWHSADPVGAEVETRDSILLTYFVDAGLLRILRNRGKRLGNCLRNEVRQIIGRLND
jgi:hypothetical protein